MCGYSARGVQKYHWSPGVGVRAVVNHPVCELGTILGSSASAVWTLNPWAISLAPLCLLTESRPSLLHYLGVALSRITPCISVSLYPFFSPLSPSLLHPTIFFSSALPFSLVLVWIVPSVCFHYFCLPYSNFCFSGVCCSVTQRVSSMK